MEELKYYMLCGVDGPDGVSSLAVAHVKGIYYAATGDAAKAVGAAAGLWGGLSGGVIGFICGGPVGSFVGGLTGGYLAGTGAETLINTLGARGNDPSDLIVHNVKVDERLLRSFSRSPPLKANIDRMRFEVVDVAGARRLCWLYEDKCYLVSLSTDRPNTAIVTHPVAGGDCQSEFKLDAQANVEEWNPQRRERWLWVKEKA